MGTLIPSWAARQDFVLLRLAMRSLLSVEGFQKLFPLAFSEPRCTWKRCIQVAALAVRGIVQVCIATGELGEQELKRPEILNWRE